MAHHYTCFNCEGYFFECDEPRDYYPYVGLKEGTMTIARKALLDTVVAPAQWIGDIISQPSSKRISGAYILQGMPELPRCPGCKKFFMVNSSRRPHFLMCGHLICQGCKANNSANKCYTCAAFYGNDANPECTILLQFVDQLQKEKPEEILKLLLAEEEEKPEEPTITLKECSDCTISVPISALIHCNDCTMVTCGGCYFKKHKGHDGLELLGIELSALQDRASTHILGVFEGYDKNFQHLHASIRDGMAAMTKAGADKLKEINDKGHYDEGKAVADEMTALSADFEKQCEEYMPVARKFNDHLISYKERIEKKE